jgi:predicted porin
LLPVWASVESKSKFCPGQNGAEKKGDETDMKRQMLGAILVGIVCDSYTHQAFAQSSVDIAGLLGSGVSYSSNLGGHSSVYENAGIQRPTILVFRGTEDLGGGTKAIFYLGTVFSLSSGSILGAPGSLFSRESYVGLSNRYGTLTFGEQRDFMFETLTIQQYSGAFYQGLYGVHQGPFPTFGVPYNLKGSNDFDRINGEALNNTVKFRSASFYGFTFGAMYGFGGVAGEFGNSSSNSFTVNYDFGSGGIGAAYTLAKSIDNGNAGIRNIGVGGRYKIGSLQFALLGTTSRNTATGAQIDALDATLSYDISPFWNLATTYTYEGGNDVLDDVHANQVSSTLTYRLSKRTIVYATFAWQRATGPGALARIDSLTSASSSDVQSTVALNIQHVF